MITFSQVHNRYILLASVFYICEFSDFLSWQNEPQNNRVLVNLSVTQAKNLSRYPDVLGQKLWAILIKTVREIAKMLVKFFRAIL